MRLVAPPGWPREVRPPDAPGWEQTATSWLLDRVTREIREAGAAEPPQDLHRSPRLAWDVTGEGYQLGNYPPLWAEWNGRYRDDVRRYWRGDGGMTGPLATRLAGSS